jgi:hypothetical protein
MSVILLFSYPNGIEIAILRWVGHVSYIKELRNAYNSLVLKPDGKSDNLADPGIYGKIFTKQG